MINRKKEKLNRYLEEIGKVAVAFSSGVDSTFLLKEAVEVLGVNNVVAFTAKTETMPKRELVESIEFCKSLGVRQVIVDCNILSLDEVKNNVPKRCYYCKKYIFSNMIKQAGLLGIENILEGSNMDDEGDYRPGKMAIEELGVLSPLKMAKLYKSEIRQLSKELNLSTYDKASFACLASRFQYDHSIDMDKINMVDKAEQYLFDLGFSQFRVRFIEEEKKEKKKIELLPEEMEKYKTLSDEITAYIENLGFDLVVLDEAGYRTGSMNEALDFLKY